MNRSGTLPRKETKRLLDSLREQGCNVRHMKKGYRVEFPNGGSTMIHLTNSDSRGTLNTRAEIKRAGLTYPFDEPQHEKRTEKMAGRQLTEEQDAALRAVLARIKTEGRFFGSVADMAEEAGVSEHTLNRRLHNLGWTTEGRGPSLVWYAPGAAPVKPMSVVEYPEIERAKAMVGPGQGHERLTFPRPGETPTHKYVKPDGTSIWPLDTGPLKAAALEDREMDERERVAFEKMEADLRARKNVTAVPAPVETKREFLDSVDSWTIAVPGELARMAEAMGLQIEVRVWR